MRTIVMVLCGLASGCTSGFEVGGVTASLEGGVDARPPAVEASTADVVGPDVDQADAGELADVAGDGAELVDAIAPAFWCCVVPGQTPAPCGAVPFVCTSGGGLSCAAGNGCVAQAECFLCASGTGGTGQPECHGLAQYTGQVAPCH